MNAITAFFKSLFGYLRPTATSPLLAGDLLPVQLAADSFDRPNEFPLNPKQWTVAVGSSLPTFPPYGGMAVVSNIAVAKRDLPTQATDNVELFTGIKWPDNQWAQVRVLKLLNQSTASILFRSDASSNNSYSTQITDNGDGTFTASIIFFFGPANDSLSKDLFDSAPLPFTPGGVLKGTVIGHAISLYWNNVLLKTIVDSNLQSGTVALWAAITNTDEVEFDDFSGGGFAQTEPVAELNDTSLNRFLQSIVVNVTGLDPTLVRPRWQAEPLAQPDISETWCAIGQVKRERDVFPAVLHSDAGDQVIRNEIIDVLCSFYGPDAEAFSETFAMGLFVEQNREEMRLNQLALVEVGDSLVVPAYIKERWIPGIDVMVRFRRQQVYTYKVPDIAGTGIQLQTSPAPGLLTETITN